jgi:SOS-response transcriptional repressor LexA
MSNPNTIATRLRTLIEAARSQKEVARTAKVSDGTFINWLRGFGVRESKLREVARNLGVSLKWIRDGEGDEEVEMANFRAHLRPDVIGPRIALRRAREREGISLAALAKRTGYSAAILDQLENGAIRASENLIETLCSVLPGLSKEDLMVGSDHPWLIDENQLQATIGTKPKLVLPEGMKGEYVPLLSSAQAGTWDAGHTEGAYDYTSILALNLDDPRAFAIKVSGNSMEPVIRDGDIVVCSPTQEIHNGEAAVVRTHSEQVFIKFWHKRGERVLLESANADYKPIEFPVTEIAGAWPIVETITAGKVRRQNAK